MATLVIIHICGAIIGILAGYAAMVVRKGSGLHGAAGTVFSVSMLVMAGSAAYIAAFLKFEPVNLVVGLLTFYLVSTAWWAAKRRDGRITAFDTIALLWVAGDVIAAIAFAVRGAKPTAAFVIFGSIALLFTVSDVRMIRRGGMIGTPRIRRHLWRMCLVLFLATFSLFPGQLRQFPEPWHHTSLIYIPHVFLVGSMIFWMVRTSARRRVSKHESNSQSTLRAA